MDQMKDFYAITLHLKGQPWLRDSNDSMHGKSMLLLLLVKAEKLGWELIASADVSAKYVRGPAVLGPFRSESASDVDSWFFRYTGNPARIGVDLTTARR